jgi:hypothetical protein
MSTEPADSVSSIDTSRATAATPAVEDGRFDRSIREDMTGEAIADRLYRVANGDGEVYDVDLATGACSCPDAEYRGEQYVCKHFIKAALVETFANTVSTEPVARVVAFTRDHGCPVDGHGGRCKGPLGRTGSLPCPTCCDAVRSPDVDEFDVWATIVAPYEGQR